MRFKALPVSGKGLGLILLLSGCATPRSGWVQESGESVVFVGEAPAALQAMPVGPVEVRSTFLPQAGTVVYVEGQDYLLDRSAGTLRRTPRCPCRGMRPSDPTQGLASAT